MSEESVIRKTHLCLSIEWEIKNFFSEQPLLLRSPVFLVSDAEWCLKYLVPPFNGLEFMSLGIQRTFSLSEQHHIAYTIVIKKFDGEVFWCHHGNHVFTESCNSSDTFLSRSELLQWKDDVVPGDVLTVHCDISTIHCDIHDMRSQAPEDGFCEKLSKFKLHVPGAVQTLLDNLKDLFTKRLHTDVVVKIGDQEIQVHRSILAARSPVFASMFDHETVEKKSGILTIVDFDPDSFRTFLFFLYTGQMDIVNSRNAVNLYKAADKYDLKDLRKECVRCMAEGLSVESVCDVIFLAVVHDESKLLDAANDFFVENVKDILPTSQWMSLLTKQTAFANELLINLVNNKL